MKDEFIRRVKDVKIVDGDTFSATIDLGFGIYHASDNIRLIGLDCPEKNTPSGVEAINQVTDLILTSKDITIQAINWKRDKYRRILANMFLDDRCLNTTLLERGIAKPYHGEKRPSITELNISNLDVSELEAELELNRQHIDELDNVINSQRKRIMELEQLLLKHTWESIHEKK